MRQTRLMSGIEAVANVLAGLLLALVLQAVLYPALGIRTSLPENLGIAGAFSATSLVRGYLLRRLFETIGARR